MLKKRLSMALILSLILGVGLFAGCRPDGHGRGAEFMMDYVTEVLDLNAAQQAQLYQMKDELLEKRRQMHADQAKYHDEIAAMLQSEEIDQARAKAIIAEHRARMDEMVDLMLTRFAEFHRTLTPEQKTKLVNKLEDFHKWHGDSTE